MNFCFIKNNLVASFILSITGGVKASATSAISVNKEGIIRFETFSATSVPTEIFLDEKQFSNDNFGVELKNVLKSGILDKLLNNVILIGVGNIKGLEGLSFNGRNATEYFVLYENLLLFRIYICTTSETKQNEI